MIIITIETDSGALLQIGRQGEHNARKIWFDLSWLIENFGDGEAVLVHQRCKDDAPYICHTTQEENRLIWTIDEIDTAYDGFGKAEIRWTVDGTLAKTVIYKTSVLASLTGDAVIPDPYESWYDRMIEQIGDNQEYAQQAANSAEQAASSAGQAASSADRAETAAESIESAAVVLTASNSGGGIVTINASINRG